MFLPSVLLAVLFCLTGAVHATNWAPTKFVVLDNDADGALSYFYSNGTIQQLNSAGIPSSTANYNTWTVGRNFATTPPIITNVAPQSDFAGVHYGSAGVGVVRIFYQTTSGDIRSVWLRKLNGAAWTLDPTIIATVALGTSFSAFQVSNSNGQEVIMIHYADANGLLTQRFSTTDAGNWSSPLTIST